MHPEVHISFSPKYREYILRPIRYTSDTQEFEYSAIAYAMEYPANLLGRDIKRELENCRRIDISMEEVYEQWKNQPNKPLEVSKASNMDDFWENYHSLIIRKKDHAFWILIPRNDYVNREPEAIPIKGCTDKMLGEKIYSIFELFSNNIEPQADNLSE